MVRTETLSAVEELQAIRNEWIDLWRSDGGSTPFHSPHWLISWCRHLADGPLFVVTVRNGPDLIGILPLFLPGGRIGYVAGTGVSDYTGALVRRRDAVQVLSLVSEAVAELPADRWEFQQLRDGDPLLDLPAPSGWEDARTEHERCPAVALPQNPETWFRSLPAPVRDRLPLDRRRLGRAGAVAFSEESHRWRELLPELFRLHRLRWETKGEAGVLAENRIQAFHFAAAEDLVRAGLLRLFTLRVGDRVIAAEYLLEHDRRMYYYIGGFDPAFEKLNVGTMVVAEVITEAIRRGCIEIDFLRGQEPYKYTFGAQDRPTWKRTLTRR